MANSKNILVTGATGFVGACLVHRLVKRKNDNIHIILRRSSDTWRIKDILKRLNLHYADLIDSREIKKIVKKVKPQMIYHLATYGAYPFQKGPEKIFQANVFGTLNLLEACAEVGFKAFVNTGSSSEYGTKSRAMSEKHLLEPNSYYGLAKASQTLLCQHFARENNLPIVNLRLFSPYGYYEEPTRLIPTLINSCLEGKDLNLVSPGIARDFSFVDDVIDAYLKVPSRAGELSGQILNIANGKQHIIKEVVSLVVKITGATVKANWGAMPARSHDTNVWLADISKAKRLLEWQPKNDLEEGLGKTINWFRNNRKQFGERYVVR